MNYISIIKSPIASELAEFEALFAEAFTSSNATLNVMLDYISQKKGKMMRPALLILIAKLLGDVSFKTLHAAVALELLHTASLVHDDVVDESEERRGQLSINEVFNNKRAILLGDYLLATSLWHSSLTKSDAIISVIARLGQELAEGEILQLANVGNSEFSEDVYFDVIRKKTAALFAACTEIAAMSVHASSNDIESARLFGEYIGICFQIKDDIFDYSDSSEIGKPTGQDMRDGKLTLPVLYALNTTHDVRYKDLALLVKKGNASLSEMEELTQFAKDSGGIDYAYSVMSHYRDKAVGLLEVYPDSDVRQSLIAYLNYVLERNK